MNRKFWKKLLPGAVIPKLEIPKPKSSLPAFDYSMTLAEWRDSGNHLGWMRQMLMSDYGKQMLGVLLNEAPQNLLPLVREKLTDIQAAIELGRVRGCAEAIETLTLMTMPVVVPETLVADYGAEQILKDQHYPERKTN